MTRKRIILLVVVAAVFAVLAFGGWQGVRAWWAWRGVERVAFDVDEARTQLPPTTTTTTSGGTGGPVEADTPPPTYEVVEYDTVLAIGNDLD